MHSISEDGKDRMGKKVFSSELTGKLTFVVGFFWILLLFIIIIVETADDDCR